MTWKLLTVVDLAAPERIDFMIKIENTEVVGWEHAIRGMRNPLNSWDKTDSHCEPIEHGNVFIGYKYIVGQNDLKLMKNLAKAGSDHGKFMRMLTVYVDITAPLYWWKEFDTYKVGTVANSCSTMHKIHAKEFTLDDFSCEHLIGVQDGNDNWWYDVDFGEWWSAEDILAQTVYVLNFYRKKFLDTKDKKYWWQMIQLLPTSYNQKRTVMLNYQVLKNMYHARKNHKLDEWHDLCHWIETLPYSELITGDVNGG